MVVVALLTERAMEAAVDEVAPPGRNNDLTAAVSKRKRTKRQRHLSPIIPFTLIPPPPAADAARLPPISPTSFYAASSEESTTTEEVNTARCLILLSQGGFPKHGGAAAAYGDGAAVYTCKTCNRCFSSFQALGGHRTSHRKPRNEKKPAVLLSNDEDFTSPSYRTAGNSLTLQVSSVSTSTFSASPSPRLHECSYCGAEFTSGQALGGHMRKHRGAGPINRIQPPESEKPENGIYLDLNLPASEDEREKSPNQRFCLPLLHHH